MLRFQRGEHRSLLSIGGRCLAAFHRVLRPHGEGLGPVDGPNPASIGSKYSVCWQGDLPQTFRTRRNANGDFGPRPARMAASPRPANAIN